MKGFEPRFADFPDYILKITEEIWEGRKIASLHTYYSDDIVCGRRRAFRLAMKT